VLHFCACVALLHTASPARRLPLPRHWYLRTAAFSVLFPAPVLRELIDPWRWWRLFIHTYTLRAQQRAFLVRRTRQDGTKEKRRPRYASAAMNWLRWRSGTGRHLFLVKHGDCKRAGRFSAGGREEAEKKKEKAAPRRAALRCTTHAAGALRAAHCPGAIPAVALYVPRRMQKWEKTPSASSLRRCALLPADGYITFLPALYHKKATT